MMTEQLQRALAEVEKLPPSHQDAIAALIFKELESDRRWEQLFADPRSQNALGALADEAIQEIEAGQFVKKGFDEL